MEKFQVAMGMDSIMETQEPKRSSCSKHVWLAVVIILGIVATVVALMCYLITKNKQLEYEISSLKKEDEGSKKQMLHMKDQINGSLRDFVDKRLGGLIQEQTERTKPTIRSKPNTTHDFGQSLQSMKDHLDVLVETVGNLTALLFRMNSSSDSAISRLRTNFIETKNDLIRLRNELTALNKSVHTDIAPSIISAVQEVKRELDMLRDTTTANVSGLWKHWNRTDAEIEDIIKLMSQQNETLHFRIAYHSDVLYSKVKALEKKQSRFHNYTMKNTKEIRDELDQTRQHLEQTFNTKIAGANASWHKAIQDIDKSLRSSITNLNKKMNSIKQELQQNMSNIVKDEFSKMEKDFQEKDRKHDSALSTQKSKLKSMEKRLETLEEKLNFKTLQKNVSNINSSGNRVFGSYASFVFAVLLYIINY
jgi:BMFP domain-containing protein YqiC